MPSRLRGAQRWTPELIVVTMSASLSATACAGTPAGPPQQPTQAPASSAPVAPPPSPAEEAGRRASETYIGMWQAMARAAETSNWHSPELGTYASDAALTNITRSLYADHANGVVTRGRLATHPQAAWVEPLEEPRTVRIDDCTDSTHWLKVFANSGQPVDDSPGGRRSVTAEVLRQPDGSWRVTRFAVEGVGTCT